MRASFLPFLPSANSLVSMDAAREAAAARDAAALQRQRDRNIKKRDEERVKRLASEKAKKTRLAAERRVRSCCSCVLVPNDSAPNSKPVLARQAREQAVLESQASSDRNREETLRRLGEGRPCRTPPATPCLNAHDPTLPVQPRNAMDGSSRRRLREPGEARRRVSTRRRKHSALCARDLRAPKPRDTRHYDPTFPAL